MPFLPARVVPRALAACRRTLRPGGWLLPGTFAGADDDLSRRFVDLRTVRSGGHPWSAPELLAMLTEHGYEDVRVLPRTWSAPVRLFAGRRD